MRPSSNAPLRWPDADTLRERAVGAYLGLAIGDALGATVEFMTPREIQARHGVHKELTGGGWLRLKPGQVTDDTTMSLALGAAILEHDGRVVPDACARAFDAWMRAKPVDIGNTVRRNLVTWRRTGDPQAPASEHDAGNGAAMRVLPVALATLGRPREAIAAASRAQAHVTHHNALSDAACECLIALVHAGLRDRPQAGQAAIARLLATQPVFTPPARRVDNPSGYVVHTLQAVLQALAAHADAESVLLDVVNRGGDADTTGAIAGMVVGARHGAKALPRRWYERLDPQIREACCTQAVGLLAHVTTA
ncbi:ADP-ribosyl-[dinitrogen reductase] hydrolase [Nitrogeniibacter mangrovi]|uniref:ADP-ribosyl-[dinitrogen reductase] hydrolase n=1 Tax=Nitrogeniibacter mangrovi TaxID=2016596 RepID=A0A6C1BAU9_9RHOO|nr:ADP-ribosyl-[dinitrogen reductase] hydrolase [Nitrogeniibacter mangrovi]QID19520.1 ADP-ribosyl-[dinitrogen reductase] hydrolase [Nitrogeniibacter mangrovi]